MEENKTPAKAEIISKTLCIRHEIAGMLHQTTKTNVMNILRSGLLLNAYELEQRQLSASGMSGGDWYMGGQFVGVYMRVLFEDDISSTVIHPRKKQRANDLMAEPDARYPGWIVFLISARILDSRKDYHISLCDQQGYPTESSYGPSNLNLLNKDRHGARKPKCDSNEIVFHNQVSLERYLDRILILGADANQVKARSKWLIQSIDRDPKIAEPTKEFYKQRIAWLYQYGTYERIIAVPLRECDNEEKQKPEQFVPRFCSCMWFQASPNILSQQLQDMTEQVKGTLDTLIKVAYNCGISSEEISKALKVDSSDKEYVALRTLIHDSEVDIVRGKKQPSLLFEPPFRNDK